MSPVFVFMTKVLLASPQHESKAYCFGRWINAISRITYQPLQVLVIDNSDSLNFMAEWQHQVPMDHLHLPEKTSDSRIALTMEAIRLRFLESDCSFWLNVESDIIVPPHAVDMMLRQIEGVDFVAAPYKHRKENRLIRGCFGCSMFNRRIAEVSFKDAPSDSHTDTFWRERVIGKYRLKDMPDHLMQLEHLDS